ncbi:MAG: adenylyltransferase/cytidyltransferase family protein [Kiritimatiellaeota bacterium]|nr:adenylyltransferase/cytidyltransferase family protein [Kiritimatiellota bacterium]
MKSPLEKILTMDVALKWRVALKAEGRKLVMTNGCFDILHQGHVEYLFKARNEGGALIVALNSDASTKELKGPGRPVNDQNARAAIIASLYFVDAVSIFDTIRCDGIIERTTPDIYVKGGDYDIDTINPQEKKSLSIIGAEIRFIPLTPGFSTTKTISKIKST